MTPYNVYSWNQTTHQGNVEKGVSVQWHLSHTGTVPSSVIR